MRQCLELLCLPSTAMRQASLAAALVQKVTSTYEAARDLTSEWTKQGKRRKNQKRRRERCDDTTNSEDPYDEYNVAELKDMLRAQGLKVTFHVMCSVQHWSIRVLDIIPNLSVIHLLNV
jgi:hypothetical protein